MAAYSYIAAMKAANTLPADLIGQNLAPGVYATLAGSTATVDLTGTDSSILICPNPPDPLHPNTISPVPRPRHVCREIC